MSRQQFSSEKNLESPAEIAFWQQVQCAQLKRDNDVSLAYAFICNPNSDKAIIISSGRVESYIKYRELMFDSYQQGYSVYCVDHRGQGLSSRLTKNPHQGHVDKFGDYVEDFSAFVDEVVAPAQHKQLFLVGHSMGCAVGALYMASQPSTFVAAAFSAPMFGINLPMPEILARGLGQLLNRYKPGREPNYVIGGRDYHPEKFEDNNLTCSSARYNHYRRLYQAEPAAQLGSPTNQWLLESLKACRRSVRMLSALNTPVLILQAEKDSVIDNTKHLASLGSRSQIRIIQGSKHEIFMETDIRRDFALTQLFNFFSVEAEAHLSEGRT